MIGDTSGLWSDKSHRPVKLAVFGYLMICAAFLSPVLIMMLKSGKMAVSGKRAWLDK